MLKEEFLEALRKGLNGIDEAGREERLAFYSDMIADRMEEGLEEAEAVRQIGPVDAVVEQILSEVPLTKFVREQIRPKRPLRAWEIAALILGAPIWLSLPIAAFAALFALYVALWAVIAALYAVDLALSASAVAGVVVAVVFLFPGRLPLTLCALGAGLVCAGLAIFLFFANAAIVKAVLRLNGVFKRIKSRIARRNAQ